MIHHAQAGPLGAHDTAASGGFTQDQFAGTFAYRFSGYSVLTGVTYRLAGLGCYQIDAQGNVTGTQRSSITALQTQGAKLQTGDYTVAGTMTMQSDGTGSATLTFTKTAGSGQAIQGEFNVMAAGSADRLWLVSSGGVVLGSSDDADELVDGEAVRIAAA
jgi:hypothetical protein